MKRFVRSHLVSLSLLGAAFVAACGGAEPQAAAPTAPVASASAAPAEVASAPAASAAPAPAPAAETPKPPSRELNPSFGPGQPSDNPKHAPHVAIVSPGREAQIPADKAKDTTIQLAVSEWATQKGGPHIHLILDNKPYKRIDDPRAPIKLGDLLGAGEELAEGEHVLVAFPGRMSHESVKMPGALAVTRFWVGKKGDAAWDPKAPMLIYSRPKGEYLGDEGHHILVDFYLANADLTKDAVRIRATVEGPGFPEGGRQTVIDHWRPYYLDDARTGEYTVHLELVRPDGTPIEGPWNDTTRTIKVDRHAPTPADPHAHADGKK